MVNRWGNSGNSDKVYFWGSKITADGGCSHVIKRRLLLRRKVMTNLDSILKSRDITLSTKVHLVKAMVYPVVMYGCESWTIKKAECRRIDAFELWCWRRLLRVPWTARRSNQSIFFFFNFTLFYFTILHWFCHTLTWIHHHLKGNQSWIFTGSTDAEAETPNTLSMWCEEWLIWKDPDAGKDWRQEEKTMTEDEMVGWHHQLDGREIE